MTRTATAERHVLLVEDNVADARLLDEALGERGETLRLHVAENAIQAYDFLDRHGRYPDAPRPDLILLDLNLPLISGRQMLKEIQAEKAWVGIPIVVLSSSANPKDIEACYRGGATSYIVKPSHWDHYQALAEMLERYLIDGEPPRLTAKVRVESQPDEPRRQSDGGLRRMTQP